MSRETKQATSILTLAEKLSVNDASLVVLEGPHAGMEVPITTEMMRIGRAEWCDVVLIDDHWVSNLHCECWWDEKGLRIRDLRSRNGITLEGSPVIEAYLVEGARLQVGKSVIQLKLHESQREISLPLQDESGLLVGRSRKMRDLFSLIPRLGQRSVTTLLLGETGTGKTSVAKAIHMQHKNPNAPFVVVNCGALPASLIEGVLFGYEKGAFTGANQSHAGHFEQAHGGVLFLDEIAEMPLELQPKLLDVIERKCVRRLGSEKERSVDFHLLCATHRDLKKEIREGRFREDLYFRISVVELEIPPLRERKEDLPLLAETLLRTLRPQQDYYITEAAIALMHDYLWPGNIRELRNILERSITFLDGSTLDAKSITLPSLTAPPEQPAIVHREPSVTSTTGESGGLAHAEYLPSLPLQSNDPHLPLKDLLADIERFFLLQALDECGGNVLKASQLLGISDSWFYNRLRKYKLNPKELTK